MAPPVRVLVTRTLSKALQDKLRALSPRIELDVRPAQRVEDIPGAFDAVEVLYGSTALPAVEAAPKLRWIQLHSAGVDHLVGHPLLATDVMVTTTSGIHATGMAEYVMAVLLAFGRRLLPLLDLQRRAEWPKGRRDTLLPMELRGSTLGIVGYGSIGREVARLASTFGMNLLATKRNAMDPADTGYRLPNAGDPDGSLLRRLYPPQALKSMLSECDAVVVAVPLTPETHGMVGAAELRAMKPTAVLINVSRGAVVDETALIEALRDGRIAGAALDVFAEEPLPESSPLWKNPNVIITPHLAGASPQYDELAVELFADNLHRYLAGQPLLNRVDPGRGY